MTDPQPPLVRTTGSLSRRMILIAAAWITLLLAGGGFALDRVLTTAITRNFDDQLEYVLRSLLTSAEIGPDGEVIFNREPADQRFIEPYSGLYWQVGARNREAFASRSLWDRQLAFGGVHDDRGVHSYDSVQFGDERLRIVEREAAAGQQQRDPRRRDQDHPPLQRPGVLRFRREGRCVRVHAFLPRLAGDGDRSPQTSGGGGVATRDRPAAKPPPSRAVRA